MSIANDNQLKRRPVHPGEILREDFMPDYGLTVSALAVALGVSRQSVNDVLYGRRPQVLLQGWPHVARIPSESQQWRSDP
jgi:antitoxin component HigA of HigAB toxin-antitoxin module